MKTLHERFPRASKDFLAANRQASSPKPQQFAREKSLAAHERKTQNTRRRILRYTSFRCRLLDEDNWCTKFFTDALRYCKALRDDTPDQVTIQVSQQKVEHRKDECTVIELEL